MASETALSRRGALGLICAGAWASGAAAAPDSPVLSPVIGQPMNKVLVGAAAPAFSLTDTDGRTQSLAASLRSSRVIVVNFWATWCGPCIRELPEFDEVYRKLHGQDLAMIGTGA